MKILKMQRMGLLLLLFDLFIINAKYPWFWIYQEFFIRFLYNRNVYRIKSTT
jgi:hypothetical protein